MSDAELRSRRALAVGMGLTFVGLAIVSTGSKVLGGPIVVIGWAGLIYGIHSFGRLGTG